MTRSNSYTRCCCRIRIDRRRIRSDCRRLCIRFSTLELLVELSISCLQGIHHLPSRPATVAYFISEIEIASQTYAILRHNVGRTRKT